MEQVAALKAWVNAAHDKHCLQGGSLAFELFWPVWCTEQRKHLPLDSSIWLDVTLYRGSQILRQLPQLAVSSSIKHCKVLVGPPLHHQEANLLLLLQATSLTQAPRQRPCQTAASTPAYCSFRPTTCLQGWFRLLCSWQTLCQFFHCWPR